MQALFENANWLELFGKVMCLLFASSIFTLVHDVCKIEKSSTPKQGVITSNLYINYTVYIKD